MGKIFNRAISGETIIYSSLVVFGYLTWFGETQSIIIDNYTNIYFTVAKALFAVVLFFAVPINLNPSRLTVLQLINKSESKTAYFFTTMALQVFSGALGMIVPEVKY